MVVDSVEVNVNAMDVFLVLEPLVTPGVVDVMVMLGGGGRTNVAVVFPKNDLFVPGEVNVIPLIILLLLIVIIRLAEVPVKVKVFPTDVTESGMFMELN